MDDGDGPTPGTGPRGRRPGQIISLILLIAGLVLLLYVVIVISRAFS